MNVRIPEGIPLTSEQRTEQKAIFEAQEDAGRAVLENPLDLFALALLREAGEELTLFWERVRLKTSECEC